MELQAGLGGHVASGRATEIQVRLFAASPVEVELEVMDGNGVTTLPLLLDEHKEKTFWLPVTPERHRPIQVRLLTSQGTVIEKVLAFKHSRAGLTVISSSIPVQKSLNWHQPSSDISPVVLSAKSLPHSSQAYDGIEAIVTDSLSLSSLSHNQYRSLGNFLGQCGIMLILDADPLMLERVHQFSGCNGRLIHSFEALSQVTPLLLKLSAVHPPKPPSPQDLMSLGESALQNQTATSLSLYLGGYMLFITLVSWHMRKARYLLPLPVLVAAAGILAWSGAGSHQFITWVETESNDNHARVSSLLLLGGDRRGESQATLGAETKLFNIRGDAHYSSLYYPLDASHRVLHGHTHLLSPRAYQLTSVARQSSRFQISISDGHPQVVFLGNTSPEEAQLMWRGKSYSVPVLSRNQRWQPDEILGQPPASAAERLLNRRLAYVDPALLLPFTTDSANSSTPAIGWLVIRHNPGRLL